MLLPLMANGELRPGFIRSEQSSVSAETYLHEDLVMQKRDARFLPGWEARMHILSQIPDPDGLLSAARCKWQKDGDSFWIEYKRIDLPESPAHKDYATVHDDEREALFISALPEIIATERLLRSAEPSHQDLLRLYAAEPSKVHNIRMVDEQIVKDALHAAGYKPGAPLPERTRSVLTHGDALCKNIILTERGYRLIDWEALGLYSVALTLGHAWSWTLLKLPLDRWERLLQEYLPTCLPLMELDAEEARVSIYWHMMRECLYWSGNEKRLALWFEKAAHVLP